MTGADGEVAVVVRDPQGFADAAVLSYGAALLASLMDGSRTVDQIAVEFQAQVGQPVPAEEVQAFVERLEAGRLLDSETFRRHRDALLAEYLQAPVRPAAHAGGAYEAEPEALRAQLAGLFTCETGPGAPGETNSAAAPAAKLRGVLSPHIDLHRGGPAFAWAYKQIAEQSAAELFVIFGTAHGPMRNLFSVSRKHFDTPLGRVETDQGFIDSLAAHLDRVAGDGQSTTLFEDEPAHRTEHSIEFQVLFLHYLLGPRRTFRIVPVLTGSFHEFLSERTEPINAAPVAQFVEAMRAAEADHGTEVFYVSGGDLAHIGRRFGDAELLAADRLKAQSDDDHRLLDHACRADSAGFFGHVAQNADRHRICGLSPTYTMLQVMRPTRGELLKYSQAVESDGNSCVSFASLAFYDERPRRG